MNTAVILRSRCSRMKPRAGCSLLLCLVLAACDDGAPDTSADADPVETPTTNDGSVREIEHDAEEPTLEDGGDEDGPALASDASAAGIDATVAGLDAQSALLDANMLDANMLDANMLDANAGDAGARTPDAAGGDASSTDASGPQCTANCAGRACGDNGCGGSCGLCVSGTMCNAQGACVCAPSCGGRVCGSNGCGGSCGECTVGTCNASGQCVAPTRSFGADVYPIFTTAGCPGCHRASASTPAAGLSLTPAEVAYTNLITAASTRCSPARAYVAVGNPDGSYLINKLTGVGLCAGGRMPLNRSPLTSAQMDIVRGWISAGATP